jgi:DNA-binding CsgD family transcriptional regulator
MPSEDDNVIEGPWPSLTDEEVRILKLVSEGRSTQEIADELGMSYSTVRRKIESILGKLRNRPS